MFLLSVISAWILSQGAFADGNYSVHCSNSPKTGWKTYYCIWADVRLYGNNEVFILNSYGTCAGSQDAGEEEPEEVYEPNSTLKPQFDLAAKSPEWRTAMPFDISVGPASGEFQGSTLYLHRNRIEALGEFTGRLKIKNVKDINFRCYSTKTR